MRKELVATQLLVLLWILPSGAHVEQPEQAALWSPYPRTTNSLVRSTVPYPNSNPSCQRSPSRTCTRTERRPDHASLSMLRRHRADEDQELGCFGWQSEPRTLTSG